MKIVRFLFIPLGSVFAARLWLKKMIIILRLKVQKGDLVARKNVYFCVCVFIRLES